MSGDLSLRVAGRVVAHLTRGESVNLGIGIPTLVADLLDPSHHIHLQTENGMLGVGPAPPPDAVDPALINAGKLPVTALPGASYFSSSASFGLIRGGHISTCVLGALQVDERGRIANWAVPGKPILGVGGAMDLIIGARRVIVATSHTTKLGDPKLVQRCAYPLTADRPADLVVTEAATFVRRDDGLVLVEVAGGYSIDWIAAHTSARFETRLEA